jgi:electron transport complex protein RnfE
MIREQIKDGLWKQNAGLVQLLGLCPTLAVTVNITNGVALGVATIFVMMLSNISISPIRKYVPEPARVPIFILVIAGLVTIVDLSINALSKPLYDALGIFIPLIVTNCIVLARVEAFASKNSTLPSLYDGFFMGLGLTFVLIILGAVREIVGNGTLFQNVHFLIGDKYEFLTIQLFDSSDGFLLAALPPGAFIALSALILFLNLVNQKR